LTEGTHTLSAKVSDAAGNTSAASASLDITVDLSAPSQPTLAIERAITNNNQPTLSGTAEAFASVQLFENNTLLGTTKADKNGNWSVQSTKLTEGTHTLSAKVSDAAGNTSAASASLDITVDTAVTAPKGLALALGSDSGVSASDNVTNRTTPTFVGSGAEAGATIKLFDSDGTTVLGTAIADSAGRWSIASRFLGDGKHTLTAKQIDIAGNTSDASATIEVTVDTVATALKALVLEADSDSGSSTSDNVTQITKPTIAGAGAKAGSTVILYDTDGQTVLGSATADNAGNWRITSSTLTDGTHVLTAKQTDAAGNISIASGPLNITIDSTPNLAPSVASVFDDKGTVTGPLTNGGRTDDTDLIVRVSLLGTNAIAGDKVQLYNAATSLGSAVKLTSTDILKGYVEVATGTLTNGSTYTLSARIIDVAGNESSSSTAFTATVDTTAPSGRMLDGLIAGAKIYEDTNDNSVVDAGDERVGYTDSSGNVVFDKALSGTKVLLGT
ncbi:MAG: hypothetical protein EBS16_10985, partial [Betaproteobacteria bacterium]|nr:hypothetical protein [Betaproteobacteria bacterium]